jgi:hypothetical protein
VSKIQLTFFLLCFCWIARGQNLTYAVFLRDEKVGELLVKRNINKDFTDFKVDSRIEVYKIINMLINYHMSARFEDGIMLRSSVQQQYNQRVNINTSTTRTGNQYFVESISSKKVLNDIIDYNLCMIYFHEPIGKTKIWSDSYGEFVHIRNMAPHRFELILPDGKRSFYTYNYGICTLVETEQLFSKIIFKLIPSK